MMRLEKITAGYHGKPILQDVTLELSQGSLTVLIGPNGSGKSTLLKTAAGLIRSMSGNVWLKDKSITQYKPREFAQMVALLPQYRGIPELTVRELAAHGRYPHLRFPRILSAEDRAIVEHALSSVRMDTLANRPLAELSGGERQRAYMAMLLAQEAEILLLDEPATHLDIGCQLEMLELIGELRKQGKTIVVVMHDLGQALSMEARLCLMEQGRMTAQGCAEELLSSGAIERAFGVRAVPLKDGQGRTQWTFERKM